jgi:hypothetical protein
MSESKKKAKKASKRIEEAMSNPEPIASLTNDELVFATELARGVTAVAALAAAKPEWNKDTIASNAYLWKRNPVIIRAMQAIQEDITNSKHSALIMTKTEALIGLSNAARASLDEIDTDSPFCVEHTVTWNANGRSEKKKKESYSTCVKLISEISGWKEVEKGAAGTVVFHQQNFLNTIIVPGIPTETTDIGERLLDENGSESRPS